MTDHVVRLYALSGSVLALFLAWAGIAANPWRQETRAAATPSLATYERRLREDAALVAELAARRRARAEPPSVRVVTLPPLTTTRTS
jgi:hypothetical protein